VVGSHQSLITVIVSACQSPEQLGEKQTTITESPRQLDYIKRIFPLAITS